MSRASPITESEAGPVKLFSTTHWSVVLTAGQSVSGQSVEALEQLCGTYWYPLFAYLRRRGYGAQDAQDLTQSFFAHLLEKDRLQTVNREKGKFRSFLIASLRNFLANEFDKAHTLKRGAQFSFLPLDSTTGEARYRLEPSHDVTPDKVFEQGWALALLEKVLNQLRREYEIEDRARLFDTLQIYLSGAKGSLPYAETAAGLKMTEGAVKMAVMRMRRRFGELLRAEIANTVSRPDEIDEEIRCLFSAVSV